MANADAILVQNANQFPPSLEKMIQGDDNFGRKPLEGFSEIASLHGISSFGGYPALSLPIGFSGPKRGAPVGLPVGLQLIGRRNDEETLIRIGYAYQKKFGVVRTPDLTAGAGNVAVAIPRLFLMCAAVRYYTYVP